MLTAIGLNPRLLRNPQIRGTSILVDRSVFTYVRVSKMRSDKEVEDFISNLNVCSILIIH